MEAKYISIEEQSKTFTSSSSSQFFALGQFQISASNSNAAAAADDDSIEYGKEIAARVTRTIAYGMEI